MLVRIMYNRRNKFNPLYNYLIVGGFANDGVTPYLGYVDNIGTSFVRMLVEIADGFCSALPAALCAVMFRTASPTRPFFACSMHPSSQPPCASFSFCLFLSSPLLSSPLLSSPSLSLSFFFVPRTGGQFRHNRFWLSPCVAHSSQALARRYEPRGGPCPPH